MALSSAMQWEVRTAGSDTLCSGGFVAGASGTDYSQQNAAQYTGTNLVIDGAVNTKCTSATHNFVAADVGNVIQVTAGSGFTVGFFEIVSVAANAATVDRSLGTLGSTAGTFAVGGALKSPAVPCSVAIDQNMIWVKSGTYTITSTTNNVANGRMTIPQAVMIRGYQTTRGDDAARPLLQASGIATTVIMTVSAAHCLVWNIDIDGASLTSIQAFALTGAGARAYNCVARNCTNNGYVVGDNNAAAVRCYATGCTTQYAFNGNRFFYCHADSCTAGGFTVGGSSITLGCIASNITGNGFICTSFASFVDCTGYNCTVEAFSLGSQTNSLMLINCIAYGNGIYGFDTGGAIGYFFQMWNCAAGANITANRRGTPPVVNDTSFITLTVDPFVNAAGGNFALNNTAGGGALLRGLGLLGAFASGTTTAYQDVGAAQHQDSGGGGGTGPNVIVSSGAGSRGGSW